MDIVLGRVTQYPSPKLNTKSGTAFEADQWLKDVAAMMDIWCCWAILPPNGTYWFGTRIIYPFQMFHLGYSPYYEIAAAPSPPGDRNINWRIPVEDPAMSYTFNAQQDFLPAGLSIDCNPTAGGTSLKLMVTIKSHT
ncbi:MAG TPA: hypothetical protein VNM47_14360 [Terriglobia bacterium]|nr:hypothetical protein [Terriglobia bacterium]